LAAGVAVVAVALAMGWVLFVPAADWLAHHDVGSAKGSLLLAARDDARGRLLTLAAGLFAVGALVYTARNFALSREGQVTDRYTKAIEQLGSDKLDVRIGGIYALGRVARDSAKDHPAVIEVLTAFIRVRSREQWSSPKSGDTRASKRKIRPDVAAAVDVLWSRNDAHDRDAVDFSGAVLPGAYLIGAKLKFARLMEADLSSARLDGADLYIADFSEANLAGADLRATKLTAAIFTGADLTGAIFTDADLTGADLTDADLTGADLPGADLEGVIFTRTILIDAELNDPIPEGWERDSESGRLKRASGEHLEG
jgi:Pentapeptide repeats (8 copies)